MIDDLDGHESTARDFVFSAENPVSGFSPLIFN
jgi:hypothetical protein